MCYKNEPLKAVLYVGRIVLLVLAFFLYLNFSTKYIIRKDGVLEITSGVFYHKLLDINGIKSITKSNTLIAAPAPSLDRIELTYGKFDVIAVSPKDKFGFAEELTKLNPRIENRLGHYKN